MGLGFIALGEKQCFSAVALQILFAGFQQPQKSSGRSFMHGEHPGIASASPLLKLKSEL